MKTIYQCEICGSRYETAKAALECEAKPMLDFNANDFVGGVEIPKVGTVVACGYPAFSWWDGDPAWMQFREHKGSRFLHGNYPLWVVVKRIPYEAEHAWRYVLWTPSYVSGQECACWTGRGHNQTFYNRDATEEEMVRAEAFVEQKFGPNYFKLPIQ